MSEKKEYTIIMTGNAASKTALNILKSKREMLSERYSADYLERAEKELEKSISDGAILNELLSDLKERTADTLIKAFVMCGKDGVFEALWRLGEETESGLKAELFSIPILQCAIEFCDLIDINPYEADSTGCTLIAAVSPWEVLCETEAAGLPAYIIGHTTGENARVVVGSTTRYLTGQTKNENKSSSDN